MAEKRVGEGPVRRETSVVKEMVEERVREGPVRRETSVVKKMVEKRVREGPVRTTDAAGQHTPGGCRPPPIFSLSLLSLSLLSLLSLLPLLSPLSLSPPAHIRWADAAALSAALSAA
jgi:hypothetical protein